ncbi:MAG: L-fucose/L-arabinose isomerase family protein [Planctomycetota bacterium]
MRRAKTMTLGVAPTRRAPFVHPEAGEMKRAIETQLTEWDIEFVNIDAVNDEGILFDRADVDEAVEVLRRAEVDALFVPHVNFGCEDATARLARDLAVPTLLWGPRDGTPLPDGNRARDTQCGLFATSKALRRLSVPFSYIVNSTLDDPVFERGLRTFLAAAAAANAFRGARIGQVSTRPGPFWTVMCNEGELLERWGVEVVPVALSDVLAAAQDLLEEDEDRVEAQADAICANFHTADAEPEDIARMAALKLALLDFADREALDALAVQCWSALQRAFGLFPCFVHGLLTDDGIPVACETDIHGALCAHMVQEAVGRTTVPFFADLTVRHPEDDNAELLWHCGPFPASLAVEGAPRKIAHHHAGPPAVGAWQIRGGPITLVRFDGDHGHYQMLLGHAEGTTGPYTIGTYLWARVGDWPLWEERLIRGPYVHHVVGVHGHIAPALYEACRFLGVAPDCVEPTEGEVRAWLRGG